MAGKRYMIVVDDEMGIRETYRQYLVPKAAGGSALDKLRKLKAPAAAPTAPKSDGPLPAEWEFVTAESGEKALEIGEKIAQEGSELCLGFFDVKMPPGIDGIETMLRLIKLFPRMRCGIVSAYNDRSVDEINSLFDLEHRNHWDFISKPFTESEIRQKARMLVATWQHAEAEQRARAELAALNENLERLVAERTHALGEATKKLVQSEARMREELTAAASLQVMLHPTSWPEGQGLEFAAVITPSVETGGDICGYLSPGGGEIVLYICDVTGHGAAAALGTSIIYSTLKAIEREMTLALERNVSVREAYSPARILKQLNQVVHQAMRGALCATCFVGVIDAERKSIRYASAGHEWPLVVRSGAAGILPLLASPRLGDERDPEFPNLEAALSPGDLLVLYTDGLTDAKNAEGAAWDRRRLFRTLVSSPKHSAATIKDAIDQGFQAHVVPGAPLDDDVTYLVVRVSTEPPAKRPA